MKLLIFEHCWICFRVRMTVALKKIDVQEIIVREDDSEAMTRLVGKRQVPILVKDCGEPMLESMEIVKYIESQGRPVFVGNERSEVETLANRIEPKAIPLTQPRYPLLGFPELATPAALNHYVKRKENILGDLGELRMQTKKFIDALTPELLSLETMIASPHAMNGTLSMDDVRILPLLRSLAVVRQLEFPTKVRAYFHSMMSRVGYKSLPSI